MGKMWAKPRAELRKNHSVFQQDPNTHLSFWPVAHGTALGSERACQAADHPKRTWTPFAEFPVPFIGSASGQGRFSSRGALGSPSRSPQEQQQRQQSHEVCRAQQAAFYSFSGVPDPLSIQQGNRYHPVSCFKSSLGI